MRLTFASPSFNEQDGAPHPMVAVPSGSHTRCARDHCKSSNGSFVPASSAKLHVLDGIYTKMGASDSIQQGRSTVPLELGEASRILQSCTGQSLVILDEPGRGTSTHDGVAIVYATSQYLLEQKRCMVLFVTHYPEIVNMTKGLTGRVASYHVFVSDITE